MGKHTDGPWEAVFQEIEDSIIPNNTKFYANIYTGKGNRYQKVNASDKYMVAQQFPLSNKEYRKEWIANAHLMAAAPELLEALEECENVMNADNEADGWLEIIQKAQAAIKKAKGEV